MFCHPEDSKHCVSVPTFHLKKMNITLFVARNCSSCNSVKTKIEKLVDSKKNIYLHVEDINETRPKGIVIVPALFIEDELYSYGEFDEEKLLSRLHLVSSGT